MAGGGVVEEVGAVCWCDSEMEFWVLLADCFDNDFVAVDAGSGGVVVEGTVDAVVGSGEGLQG